MLNNLINMSIDEIRDGYSFNKECNSYVCNICRKKFEEGEVFQSGNRFFSANRMIGIHMVEEHPDMLEILASHNKKYTGITDNQKEILQMLYLGMTDNEIAKKTGVAAATIRHQKYIFREKAKQAKLYLAIYELAHNGVDKNKVISEKSEEIIDIHGGAKMVDERYMVTKTEEDKILEAMFSSLSPLKLKVFSSKEKKKIVILKKISEQFEKNKHYSEKEVNAILKQIHEDFATIRRYLIEYGFMDRTNDCKEYWLK